MKTDDIPTLLEIRRGDVVQLRLRARWSRALRVPAFIWYYRRKGVSWTAARAFAHFAVWYRPKTRQELML